jgi:hypothetical protein
VTRLPAHRSADSNRLACEPRVARHADHLYGFVSPLGNRATARLLQRCTVDPMPIIYRQFGMWRQGAKILDLNCGWYSQLAAVDHFYVKHIRGRLTVEQQRQLEGAATPHLSFVAGPFGEPFGVSHYVTVVEVRGDQMRYLDALTFGLLGDRGTMRSQPFAKMSEAVTSIDYVDRQRVEAMFSAHLAQASTSRSSTSSSLASKT